MYVLLLGHSNNSKLFLNVLSDINAQVHIPVDTLLPAHVVFILLIQFVL